jgi:hypothetical protein
MGLYNFMDHFIHKYVELDQKILLSRIMFWLMYLQKKNIIFHATHIIKQEANIRV